MLPVTKLVEALFTPIRAAAPSVMLPAQVPPLSMRSAPNPSAQPVPARLSGMLYTELYGVATAYTWLPAVTEMPEGLPKL